MPSLIKPGSVKIVTQEGEVQVSITLELNINLNGNGDIVNSTSTIVENKKEIPKENTEWAIPDFGTQKINFGKRD